MTRLPALPRRLLAPPPGWVAEADVVVVGSGIAGLTVALRSRPAGRVLVVTKDVLAAGSTRWAQGGIAAALAGDDSPAAHRHDTLAAGVGLCDEEAVHVLVTEGPAAVRRLIGLGARFDRHGDGHLALTREGGHRRDRIAHAGGDATGAEISRALVAAVRADPGIEVIEHALALDLLTDGAGRACGVTLHVMGEGTRDGVGAVHARAVVLATGGLGQVYAATTNPSVSTGDGVALALRAGAVVRDLEFVQFHPTVLWLGRAAKGQQPLISEAVRGEGAVLVDASGERFMAGVHPMADLAPRDVVTKAVFQRMRASRAEHVWLDGRAFGEETWRVRFPTILETCREHGIDPVHELIPVVPACHYASGGVRTDRLGRTSVPGLYACGESACTGVHGANRLASNSLLEGLVFAERIAADLVAGLPRPGSCVPRAVGAGPGVHDAALRPVLQRSMSTGAGVLRSAVALDGVTDVLAGLGADHAGAVPCTENWEATNLLTVAMALTAAARAREETRGCHWRADFPDRDDASWRAHLDLRLDDDGRVTMEVVPHEPQRAAALEEEFRAAGVAPEWVAALVADALAEDEADHDVTSAATVPADHVASAEVVARAEGVVAGLAVAEAVFRRTAGTAPLHVVRRARDGEPVRRGDVLMTVTGRTRDLLRGERTALNVLGHLSGIATLTRRWVEAIEGTGAQVRDTRKTTPRLRLLEKYAVRCGGGSNHRMSLADAALVKDNHVVAAGGTAAAFRAVRALYPDLAVEVEVDTVAQCREAVDAGADLVLLDNMSRSDMRACVAYAHSRGVRLEASGGLTLEGARAVADTGVDFLAVGALTHSAPVLDIALDLTLDRTSEGGT